MRRFSLWLIAPCALLAMSPTGRGRRPASTCLPSRVRTPHAVGGGGAPFVPLIPWLGVGGSGDGVGCWIILMLAATVLVLVVGIWLGQALGRWSSAGPRTAGRDHSPKAASTPTPGFASVPAMDALILTVVRGRGEGGGDRGVAPAIGLPRPVLRADESPRRAGTAVSPGAAMLAGAGLRTSQEPADARHSRQT